MRSENSSKSNWEDLIIHSAATWQDIEISHLDAGQLAQAYQSWQVILSNSSAAVPFDATPVDFNTALRQAASIQTGPLIESDSAASLAAHTPSSVLELDLTAVGGLISRGALSSVEVTRLALSRLEEVQAKTNACVAIEADAAIKHANLSDNLLRAGTSLSLLHGVPLAHKDLFYQANSFADAGWCGIRPRPVRPDAGNSQSVAIQQLNQAGAINLGRLHMTEFAFDPSGLNSELGPCRNPWNLNDVPGGSSSGSAVVVASRAVFGALGSDTGGSVRIPASLCGITGLKPTYGLVSTQGAMPLSHSNDHIGPLARSAADCAALMQAITDPAALKASAYQTLQRGFEVVAKGAVADLKGLKIGVPVGFFMNGIAPAIQTVLDESLKKFQEMGATIQSVSSETWETLNALGAVITRVEAAARIARLKLVGGLHPAVITRFEQGIAIPGSLYVQALNERGQRLRSFLSTVMQGVDVLHLPVCRIHTPGIADFEVSAEHATYLRSELTILNRTFNYLGVPGLSLPAGFVVGHEENRMPVGIQLVGKPYADARLLAIGAAWQQCTTWHRELPVALTCIS